MRGWRRLTALQPAVVTPEPTLFHTARLRVRRLAACDLDAMGAVYGDADAMRWVGDAQPLSREACVEWLAVTDRNYATRGYGMATLQLNGGDAVVGFCGLVHPGGQLEAEIKYALRREFWNQGYASEAAIGMLDYGAHKLGLRRVIATAAPANFASHRVLLKAGFNRVHIRRNDDGSCTEVFTWARTNPPKVHMRTGE
jgi:RimJ/RimL family protein N-acetyltransferase